MPVWMVRNTAHGNLAFSTLNEGLGKVLRYGANSPEVIARLKWIEGTLAPALSLALEKCGPLELKPLMARALHMGDELHNRNVAATSLLLRHFAPALLRPGVGAPDAAAVLDFINGNDHFFLNIGMAACKAMLGAAAGVSASSMVVTMARNGTDFGIQLSGTGARWGRRHRAARDRQHAGDDEHHARTQPRVHPAGAEFRRHARGNRRALVALAAAVALER